MRRVFFLAPLGGVVGLLAVIAAEPVCAQPTACDDLLSARAPGRSAAEVARDFGTTEARIEACARVAEQRARLDAARAETASARLQRRQR